MSTSFSTLYANNLEEVQMIAGDEQIFTYSVYTDTEAPLSLVNATCNVFIFRYGDPNTLIGNLSGSIVISGSVTNQFRVTFSGSGLSGVYQQQVRIVDSHGGIHYPSQGKIIIFPGATTT